MNKTIALFVCASATLLASIHERTVEPGVIAPNSPRYVVHYDVYECDMKTGGLHCMTFMPAIAGAQVHYPARIAVYRAEEIPSTGARSTFEWNVPVGEPIEGYWTEDGCTEDDPVTLVKGAIEREMYPDTKDSGIAITGNGANWAIIWECENDKIDLRPEFNTIDDSVAIHAYVCRDHKWVKTKIKIID